MTNDEVRDLLSRLPNWNRFLDSYELPPVMVGETELFELRLRLVNLRRRLRDGPLAPLRIAFFGPTGAGKSKLFSSLIGRCVSESGYRRPFTRRSCYYIHDEWRSLVPAIHGEPEIHQDGVWKDIILIDTPDFDSVEKENRAEAERVFMESDGFLFVTDALKYADASTWEYLRKIESSDKLCQVILNKVNSQTVPLSFEQRFAKTFGTKDSHTSSTNALSTSSTSTPHATALKTNGTANGHQRQHSAELAPLIVVPEFPIDDAALIQSDHPAMQQLVKAARQFAEGDRFKVSVEMFQYESEGLFHRASSLLEKVQQRRSQLDKLNHQLGVRFEECRTRLANRLSSGLDPAVRDEVFQRVMKRMEKIDVLRYPRRLLSMPVRGLTTLVTTWIGSRRNESAVGVDEVSSDPITSETFHLLETELIRLADETRIDITSRPGLENILSRQQFRELRLAHADVEHQFAEHQQRFSEWVAVHARDTAAEITGENKIKFILSQLLFNAVVIGAQASTGGTISALELGVDSVLSPWVAKAVSIAIGNEKVGQFEQAAHEEHQRSLAAILSAERDQFTKFLGEAGQGLDELEQTLVEIVRCEPRRDEMVNYFRQSVGDDAVERRDS